MRSASPWLLRSGVRAGVPPNENEPRVLELPMVAARPSARAPPPSSRSTRAAVPTDRPDSAAEVPARVGVAATDRSTPWATEPELGRAELPVAEPRAAAADTGRRPSGVGRLGEDVRAGAGACRVVPRRPGRPWGVVDAAGGMVPRAATGRALPGNKRWDADNWRSGGGRHAFECVRVYVCVVVVGWGGGGGRGTVSQACASTSCKANHLHPRQPFQAQAQPTPAHPTAKATHVHACGSACVSGAGAGAVAGRCAVPLERTYRGTAEWARGPPRPLE
jgi:hypothetical protein